MIRHLLRTRIACVWTFASVVVLVIPQGGATANFKPFLSPSTAAGVVVASTSGGRLVVLPSMVGPAPRLGSPGAVAVAPRGNIVYAAPEWGRRNGQLLTFSLVNRRLKELSSIRLGGTGAVSIAVSPDAKSLVVANYSSSSVSVVRLDARGLPGEVATLPTPKVPSNPHAVAFLGTTVVVTDLRNNRLDLLSIDAKPGWLGSVPMRSGDGPRSLAIVNDRQFLVSNELSNTVLCLVSEKGSITEQGRLELGGSVLSDLSSPAPTSPIATSVGPSVAPTVASAASAAPTVAPTVASAGSAGSARRSKPADIVSTSPTTGAVVVRAPDELIRFSVGSDCQLRITSREFDVVDRPRPLVTRGTELWMGISTAVMVSGSGDNWGAIPTSDPVYAMAVVR